ncbi:protein PHYTOCHROME KINASE SUBSTRATE 4-like [Zingiber officinale]|uniref:Uncharacterized protein n=1 Tax=Zingiber officinale TaxID=94328 RepID=A0A8J5KAM1_ZINOF|nr:protein PHYTOCHROME KINASE SUBSTRATE 4-like [Zingiber officinale]KAG6475411.1 hypothetical protein ZIOFF_064631 [Zingiber officinale]
MKSEEENGEMERRSAAASFSGGCLHQRPAAFPTPHFILLAPDRKPHLGDPLVLSDAVAGGHGRRLSISRRIDDAELNIFDAERYFREGDEAASKRTFVVDEALRRCDLSEGLNGRGSPCQTTPTESSEASWNSKSGLLPHRAGRRRSSGKRVVFGRSCPCSGKKSVDVEEKKHSTPIRPLNASFDAKKQSFRAGEVGLDSIPERSPADEFNNELDLSCGVVKMKITPGNWGKDRSFFNVASRFSPEKTFPAEISHRIMNSGRHFADVPGFSFPVLSPPDVAGESPRDSLEVFRSTAKTSELSQPRPEEDAASDTSSDLFEIESLSTCRRRDSLDELEGRRFVGRGAAVDILQIQRRSLERAATPSVAPREASVATAEGFDRKISSAASDHGESRCIEEEHDLFTEAVDGARRKAGGLLNCRS